MELLMGQLDSSKNPIIDDKSLLANSPKAIIAAAIVVVNSDNEILLIKSPWRGWEIPGGQVEEKEQITLGAIREVKEESGIDVEITQYCGLFQNVQRGVCSFLFKGKPIGGEYTTSDESTEVGYFKIEDALKMVTWLNYRERIEMCLNEEKHPFVIEFNI